MVNFFLDDDDVDAGDFGRARFCDGLGWGEGVFGSAGAFAALLEALVRPFDAVEYDGGCVLYFLVLVLLPPAIVQNFARWFGCKWRCDIICDYAEIHWIRGYCSYSIPTASCSVKGSSRYPREGRQIAFVPEAISPNKTRGERMRCSAVTRIF